WTTQQSVRRPVSPSPDGGGVLMNRLVSVALAFLVALVLAVLSATTAIAAESTMPHSGRVLVATGGDLVVPAGDQADAVIVIRGHAEILGRVNAVVVVDGTASVTGTTIESLVVVRGSALVT